MDNECSTLEWSVGIVSNAHLYIVKIILLF